MEKPQYIEPVKIEKIKRINPRPSPKIKPEWIVFYRAKKHKIRVKRGVIMMDRLLKFFLDMLWPVFLQWVFPYPIYKKENGTNIKGDDGNPIVNWPLTIIARVLSVVTVIYGSYTVLGQTVSEWVSYIQKIIGIL